MLLCTLHNILLLVKQKNKFWAPKEVGQDSVVFLSSVSTLCKQRLLFTHVFLLTVERNCAYGRALTGLIRSETLSNLPRTNPDFFLTLKMFFVLWDFFGENFLNMYSFNEIQERLHANCTVNCGINCTVNTIESSSNVTVTRKKKKKNVRQKKS